MRRLWNLLSRWCDSLFSDLEAADRSAVPKEPPRPVSSPPRRIRIEPPPLPVAEEATEILHASRVSERPKWDPQHDESEGEYPPDWNARRAAVYERDNYECQALGCIYRGKFLDTHHIKPRSEGGSHRLENLISLCRIHHAIVHLHTHAIEVASDRCTVVSRHWKRRAFSNQRIEVPPYIRRFGDFQITGQELAEIRTRFGLVCPTCRAQDWSGMLQRKSGKIWTQCAACNDCWEFQADLTELTGVEMASVFLPTVTKPFVVDLEGLGVKKPASRDHYYQGCLECRAHGRHGYLVRKVGTRGRFRGCSEYPLCRYTLDGW